MGKISALVLASLIVSHSISTGQSICDLSVTPTNLESTVLASEVVLRWDHTPYSSFAMITGFTPSGQTVRKIIASATPGEEPESYKIPMSALDVGT